MSRKPRGITNGTECERCGKDHIGTWVWLELNSYTGRFYPPGTVPANESQGLFRFGPACAKKANTPFRR